MCKLTLTAGLCVIIASLGLPGLATGNPCQGKTDGNYAKPDDDNSFYQCVAGMAYVQKCQPGLVYSVSQDACDYATPSQTPNPVLNFCNGKANGYYANTADPNSFYQCAAGETHTHSCTAGLVFSEIVGGCAFPTTPVSPVLGFCSGKADGNYAKLDDQYSFYCCAAGNTYVQPCQSGLVYSVTKDACDYPAQSGSSVGGFCSGKGNGNYAKPDDPNSFYQCVAGETYVQQCQVDLVYSASKDACDHPV